MFWIACYQLIPLRQFKIRKIKSGRDRAPHQRERRRVPHPRTEPASCLHHGLEYFPRLRIAAKLNLRISPSFINNMHHQSPARVEVPHLVRAQPVKRREVLAIQQKIDGRGHRPAAPKLRRQSRLSQRQLSPVSLPIVPALRMRDELQFVDPIPRVNNNYPPPSETF